MENQEKFGLWQRKAKYIVDYSTAIIDLAGGSVAVADLVDSLVSTVREQDKILYQMGYTCEDDILKEYNNLGGSDE